jgi:hypothetical protein
MWANGQGIAGSVPGWTAFTLGQARYQSRYLSNSGRVFFDSEDGLVPGDVNHNLDVYEFEPAGAGGCREGGAGFNTATGGCVGLVSSGAAAGESAFVDASDSGDDVFFLTGERLVGADRDTALDLYDAHVCSSEAPCFEEAAPAPPCLTTEACRGEAPPLPTIFGAPASATFSGPGNATPAPPPAAKPKTAAQVRIEKLTKALKACHKDKKKKKRQACEKAAHKAYGAAKRKQKVKKSAKANRRTK